jgi:hypothetical protein
VVSEEVEVSALSAFALAERSVVAEEVLDSLLAADCGAFFGFFVC